MWVRLLAISCLAACGGDAPTNPDAPVTPDAGNCMAAASSCQGDDLHVCAAAGTDEQVTTCTWGCVTSPSPRCQTMTPASNGAVAMDLDPANFVGLADFSLSEPVNGDLGTIGGVQASARSVNYRLDPDGIAVFRFKSLSIGVAKLFGTKSIVLAADGPITIGGPLDLTGQCESTLQIAGPGGGDGGSTSGADGALTGGGTGAGGAGAGGGGGGGWGGNGGDSGGGETGGASNGDVEITILRGGAGGGAGAGVNAFHGGGGGGAVHLISNTKIELINSGSINAGGCGGRGGGAGEEGGGGGSGGTILLEAPQIILGATNTIAANGGGGGGATSGQPGFLGSIRASGGGSNAINAAGGAGGAGANADGLDGAAPVTGQTPGGGGGAVGRIRINTRDGAGLTQTGTVSPAPSTGTVTVQ